MPPDWLWVALGAVGMFVANQLWPFVRSLVDMGYKAELEERKAELEQRKVDAAQRREAVEHQEERYLAALELGAQAQRQQSENGREIAAAIRTIAETRVADNLVLQRVERELEKALALLVDLATLQGRPPADTRIRPRRTKLVKGDSDA